LASLKGLNNVVATKLGNQTIFQMISPLTNECRPDILGLAPLSARYWWAVDSPDNNIPMIYAHSPAVLLRPTDWGPCKEVSGYWFLDRGTGYQPNDALAAFLDGGPPPVYVGPGSAIDHDHDSTTRMVIDAMARVGQRAILQEGWSGLGAMDLPDSILAVDDVPHDWLFPQLAAVVHHGGAGTTAAGLRAGLPNVVVPFYGDQFFWAWRVRALGVGPRGIPRRTLTSERLAKAVRAACADVGMRTRAHTLSERIRAEDGVGRAVAFIEQSA
jgi:sterol 3beta-glucosyltransferase